MSQFFQKRNDPTLFLGARPAPAQSQQQFSEVELFLFEDPALPLHLLLVIPNTLAEFSDFEDDPKVALVVKNYLGFPVLGEHIFPESDLHFEYPGRKLIGDVGEFEGRFGLFCEADCGGRKQEEKSAPDTLLYSHANPSATTRSTDQRIIADGGDTEGRTWGRKRESPWS